MDDEAVIDASVAVKLVIDEEHTSVSRALFVAFEDRGVARIAPPLLPFEITNALHKRVAAAEMTAQAAVQGFRSLASYKIEIYTIDALHEQALELAHRMGMGASYDAHYLALALARDCELWTADDSFFRAARQLSDKVRWLTDFNPGA